MRAKLHRLALVPTMGALHDGHLSLMRQARDHAPYVAVSIFVNPTQFGPNEDFLRYPRPIEQDLALCQQAGVDAVFHPAVQQIYPPSEPRIAIDLPTLTGRLEGAHRPGHFAGVCAVVTKLFNIVRPDVALFGVKDYQQFAVLSGMVKAMSLPIEMIGCLTVREPDGLAMSSRNRYLGADERQRALSISQALFVAQRRVAGGERDAAAIIDACSQSLRSHQLQIDYVAVVDPQTLNPVKIIDQPTVMLIAARVGATRLIDNLRLAPPAPSA